MKRIKARESGATDMVVPFGCSIEIVTDATRDHERREVEQMRSPAIPPHLRDYLDWRLMVKHEVSCGRG